MQPFSLLSLAAIPVLLAGLLAGCTTSKDAKHLEHHPAGASTSAPATMGRSTDDKQMGMMGMMDMKAMCEMHKKMMTAKSPGERQSMMDGNMKSMSPEMMEKHMQMMQEKCK